MLIHLDTSVLIDAFTGPRRLLGRVEAATEAGHVLAYCTLVEYEWLRGPRTKEEEEIVRRFFGVRTVVAFGEPEAAAAASLFRQVKRGHQRQADLAVAACAIEHGAQFWTLIPASFEDVPGLTLFRPEK